MNKKTLLGLGFAALVAIFALNTRHALNDYGVRQNPLHAPILAQTNTGGNGSGDTSGGGAGGSSAGNGGDSFFYK